MSLFIGALAFPGDPALIEEAKIGIVGGSVLSALAGFLVLRLVPLHPAQSRVLTMSGLAIDLRMKSDPLA